MQTVDYRRKKSPGLSCKSISGSWTAYKTCINTFSEEVKVVMQSRIKSEWVAVAIRREICLLTQRTCFKLG